MTGENSAYTEAKERALSLLDRKMYTRKELIHRLLRYVEEEYAEAAADRMEELGLIDDYDYAERLARDLWNLKGYGILRIRDELRRHGLGDDEIQQALLEFSEIDLRENLARMLLNKYPDCLEGEKERRRAVNGLYRLGYAPDDIYYVLRHLEEFFDMEE